jgi:hypothetical protein
MLLSWIQPKGIPIDLHRHHRQIKAFLILILIRFGWDLGMLLVAGTEDDYGIRLPLYRFLLENELRVGLTYSLTGWIFPLLFSGGLSIWGRKLSPAIWRWGEILLVFIFSISLLAGGYFLLNYGYAF